MYENGIFCSSGQYKLSSHNMGVRTSGGDRPLAESLPASQMPRHRRRNGGRSGIAGSQLQLQTFTRAITAIHGPACPGTFSLDWRFPREYHVRFTVICARIPPDFCASSLSNRLDSSAGLAHRFIRSPPSGPRFPPRPHPLPPSPPFPPLKMLSPLTPAPSA
jgi:hypothetical protein